jgi:fumarate reductase subunit C
MNDEVPYYRRNSLNLMMTLVKKVSYFQKEPYVMVIINKIGDTDKSIVQMVQKYIAIIVRVGLLLSARTTMSLVKSLWIA